MLSLTRHAPPVTPWRRFRASHMDARTLDDESALSGISAALMLACKHISEIRPIMACPGVMVQDYAF